MIEDVDSPEPRINPRWDSELEELAKERDDAATAIADLAETAARTWGRELELKCERDKVRGFVFRAKKTHDKTIRKIAGYERTCVSFPWPTCISCELTSV